MFTDKMWGWPTLLQQDPLKQRVLVPQHQAFVCGSTMTLLEVREGFLILLDGCFELLDIFGPAFTERSLGLPVPLFSLFGSSIDLAAMSVDDDVGHE